jgi:hypothetical protein
MNNEPTTTYDLRLLSLSLAIIYRKPTARGWRIRARTWPGWALPWIFHVQSVSPSSLDHGRLLIEISAVPSSRPHLIPNPHSSIPTPPNPTCL